MINKIIKKALLYRVIVVILNAIFLYLWTGKLEIALGYSIFFSIITTIVYILMEIIWKE